MDKQGYRPGIVWAPAISLPQLICGPLLALGLFTRLAAVPIVLFLLVSNIERWRVGKYFWNQLGLEYTLMWTVAAFYFLVHSAGERIRSTTSSFVANSVQFRSERIADLAGFLN
jgi:uncharacterized membrane protein YphA (DoxX/SURF4 family)